MFHGEPTVGLQANIPLSRRVQLAVLAHIRHTHTRYDKLLRETTWMNARKVVELVCLDVLVKWRGDEETGRDQMDEILREVVIITDSEDGDDTSDEESSEEEGEITSDSSEGEEEEEPLSLPNSRNQQRLGRPRSASPQNAYLPAVLHDSTATGPIASRTRAKDPQKAKKAQRGFKRYQAAWEDALNRVQEPTCAAGSPYVGASSEAQRPPSAVATPLCGVSQYPMREQPLVRPSNKD